VSGGVYAYGQKYLSAGTGFLAGFLFLVGKTASSAAIALIAANYLAPESPGVVAAVLVLVFALLNISGIRTTAVVSLIIASVVVGVVVISLGFGASAPFDGLVAESVSPLGVLQAAALMFFAFAGYARMATLGGEVARASHVLPRVIVGTLLGVLGLYAFVGWVVVSRVGPEALAVSATPVADAVGEEWRVVVVAVAALAALGSLATVLAGLSRTASAMALAKDLPSIFGFVGARFRTPVVAEATMALAAIVVVLLVDPLWLVGLSSGTILSYYAISHLSALAQPASERIIPRVLPVIGVAGCVLIALALPVASVLATLAVMAVAWLVWWVMRATRNTAS
jgi:APA family basic amino acid/polyamine antiporter